MFPQTDARGGAGVFDDVWEVPVMRPSACKPWSSFQERWRSAPPTPTAVAWFTPLRGLVEVPCDAGFVSGVVFTLATILQGEVPW